MNQKGFTPILVIFGVLVIVIVAGGAYYLGRSTTPQPQNLPTVSSTPQPTVKLSPTPIPTDYSQDRTIKESGDIVSINFKLCTTDTRRIWVAFGSTTISIKGKSDNTCILDYGGEVENPNWDGKLPFKCKVPDSLGIIEFSKNMYGVLFSPIQQYCTKE